MEDLVNLPYKLMPKTWDEFFGQPEAVNVARKFLTEKPYQAMFITGLPGVGKTAFTLLLIKSAKCLKRQPNEINPCNECASCLSKDIRLGDSNITGVHWLSPGANAEEGLGKQVKNALIKVSKGQVFTGQREDITFVVVDEFHKFDRGSRQEFLQHAELPRESKVVFIFITMSPELIDSTERMAFQRRLKNIKLRPLTDQQIFEYLLNHFPECPPETASLITRYSKQSLGLSLSKYQDVLDADPYLSPEAAAHALECANNDQRIMLWQKVLGETGNRTAIKDLKSTLEMLSRVVDERQLADQLIDDIINTADIHGGPTSDQSFAIRLLNQFLSNYRNTSLLSYLIQFSGLNIVSEEGVRYTEDYNLNYAKQ